MYLIFLIARDRYADFEINSYIQSLQQEKKILTRQISAKQEELAYTQTPSYIDMAAKTAQNLQNPGEKVYIFPENIGESKDKNSSEPALIITTTQNERSSHQLATWRYYLLEKTYQK